jgi:hypothetical protein
MHECDDLDDRLTQLISFHASQARRVESQPASAMARIDVFIGDTAQASNGSD